MVGSNDLVFCRECGEANPVEDGICSMCGTQLPRRGPVVMSSIAIQAQVLTVIVISLGLAVGLGLIEPGWGIAFAMILIAPLVRTVIVLSRRAEVQKSTSVATTISLYFASVTVALVVATVVGLSAFVTFCFTCLAAGSAANSYGIGAVVGGVCAVAVSGVLIYRFTRKTQARIERDIKRRSD